MTDRAIPATQQPHESAQDQLSDFKINFHRRGGSRLREVTKGEPVVQFDDLGGVVAGFRTPLYEQGIGVPGGHVHFIDDSYERGGHVLDYALNQGTLEVCLGTDLHLALPLTTAFRAAHLTPDDLVEQVQQTERHT